MADIRAVGCPLCGRVAKTGAELTAQGCEGKHEPLVALSEVEPLVEAARNLLSTPLPDREEFDVLSAALKPFEDSP